MDYAILSTVYQAIFHSDLSLLYYSNDISKTLKELETLKAVSSELIEKLYNELKQIEFYVDVSNKFKKK